MVELGFVALQQQGEDDDWDRGQHFGEPSHGGWQLESKDRIPESTSDRDAWFSKNTHE